MLKVGEVLSTTVSQLGLPPPTHPVYPVLFFPVKLWSTNLDNSVASIEAKANVCCVKFSPTSRYHLAFGCAGKN